MDRSIASKANLRQDMDQFLKIFEFDRVPNEENFVQNSPSSNIQSPLLKSKGLTIKLNNADSEML